MTAPTSSVHATRSFMQDGKPCTETIVRYVFADRVRWAIETAPWFRYCTVHEAIKRAIVIERMGGTIHEGVPGGRTFDLGVTAERTRIKRELS